VYGDEAAEAQVGNMEPVPGDLVSTVEDGASLDLLGGMQPEHTLCGGGGGVREQRVLDFLHVEGHAKHHIAIYDRITNTCFTGDAFGTRFPRMQRLLGLPEVFFPTTTPIDFDYEEHIKTINRVEMLGGGLHRFCPTHFGMSTEISESKRQMTECLAEMEKIRLEALKTFRADASPSNSSSVFDAALQTAVQSVKTLLERHILGLVPRTGDAAADAEKVELVRKKIPWDYLKMDTDINALGLVVAAQRAFKKEMVNRDGKSSRL
jgi:hypothetical protein